MADEDFGYGISYQYLTGFVDYSWRFTNVDTFWLVIGSIFFTISFISPLMTKIIGLFLSYMKASISRRDVYKKTAAKDGWRARSAFKIIQTYILALELIM